MSNSHLIVVGSGIAGLYGALLAAESGMRVTLLTKGTLTQSNTQQAQGGICAVLDPADATLGDSVASHMTDTLTAGAGQCDPAAVGILCSEAASDIAALERFGVVFDKDPGTGKRALGLEGAHSAARILHAGGDATGAVIANGLIAAVRSAVELGLMTVMEGCFVTELLTSTRAFPLATNDGETQSHATIRGVAYLAHNAPDHPSAECSADRRELSADAVLLASGGAGQLFEFTTNPAGATGDGVALAWRAGAVVGDLEYFQFHPTALAVGGNFLISEAVRGAGAVLRDVHGERFMQRYHRDGDLAPRDVVARSMAAHLAFLARKSPTGASGVPSGLYLDATGVEEAHGAGYLARRFPTIAAVTADLGFDWRHDWLPVAPAAHYWMGGVATDLQGRTSVPGLYAAGEVACTGVHGANRLASNSLLEGLVFSRRAVVACAENAADTSSTTTNHWPALELGAEIREASIDSSQPIPRHTLRQLMSTAAGVVRSNPELRQAAAALRLGAALTEAQPSGMEAYASLGWKEAEDQNLGLVAGLLIHAALARENSIGAHFRSDFPQQEDTAGIRTSNFWANSATRDHPADPKNTHLSTDSTQRESETV